MRPLVAALTQGAEIKLRIGQKEIIFYEGRDKVTARWRGPRCARGGEVIG